MNWRKKIKRSNYWSKQSKPQKSWGQSKSSKEKEKEESKEKGSCKSRDSYKRKGEDLRSKKDN